jgi:hypothetical protein
VGAGGGGLGFFRSVSTSVIVVEPAHILLKGEGHMSVGRVSGCGLGGSFRNVPKSVQAPTHVMLLIVEL